MAGVLLALIVINGLVLTGTSIWVLVLASREGTNHVVLCLIVPFYYLYYVVSRFDQLKPAGGVYAGSLGLHILLIIGMAAVGGMQQADAVASNASQEAPQSVAEAEMSPDAETSSEPVPTEPDPGQEMPEPTATDPSESPTEPTPESTTPEPTPEPVSEPTTPEAAPVPQTPAAPPVPVEPKFPPGLQGDAQRAFHEGRFGAGKTYLRAALLSSDDPALWSNVRWYSGLGRPEMGLRWGIGLQMAEQPSAPLQQPNNGTQPATEPAPEQPPEGTANTVVTTPAPALSGDLAELRRFTGEFGPKLMETLPKSTLDRLLGPLGENVQVPQGVQFVGIAADLSGVQSLARQKGVDVLLVAAISFKVYGLNRAIDAQLTVRLIDVANEKRLWSSKTLSSNQVKAAIAKGQDPIRDTVRSLTDYLEHSLQPLDKPDLDAGKLRQRVDAVAREEHSSPLPALLELRYYQRQGAISMVQAEAHYRRLTDSDSGTLLASGSPEERARVIERFLPQSQ